MLDGKNRIIHFVNERAVTIMDNNEPREVNFAGPPRNVYIEGLVCNYCEFDIFYYNYISCYRMLILKLFLILYMPYIPYIYFMLGYITKFF